jgi:hypothetical protein
MDMMEIEKIEQVSDVVSAKAVNDGKVKNEKKAVFSGKPCAIFKDMECRIPLCDMDVCSKCSEGFAYCSRVNYIKSLIQRILMFVVAFLCISEL